MSLSSVPSLEEGLLQPRHVDLRAFVYATGRRKKDYLLADLALTRAGALTLAELALTGTPAVLVPSPNVAEDDQTHNARAFEAAGAARLLEPIVEAEPGNSSVRQLLARAYFQSAQLNRAEEQLRELFFFDMLEAGIYLARRGMVALSLPVGEAELDRFVAAVAAFLDNRAEQLRAGGVTT